MPSITYIQPNGDRCTVEIAVGVSVMQGAQNNTIEGIIGECGGACSCGTCHCYVEERWRDKLPSMRIEEKQTLECSIDVTDESRLSCQLIMTVELDGLVVRLPDAQI